MYAARNVPAATPHAYGRWRAGLAALAALAGAGSTVTDAAATPPHSIARPAAQHPPAAAGQRLVVAVDADAPDVAIRIAWEGGLALETALTHGHHALAAAAIEACAEPPVVRALGGSIEAVIERDRFGLRAVVPADGWRDGLAAIASCLGAPRLEAARVAEVRQRIDARDAAAAGSASGQALAAFTRARFGDHPLARELASAPLAHATPAELARWFAARYVLGRAVVAVVGPAAPDEVADAIGPLAIASIEAAPPRAPAAASASASRPSPARAAAPAAPPDLDEPAQLFLDRTDDTGAILIGLGGLAAGDPDRAALDVLAAILDAPDGPLAPLAAVAPARRLAIADTRDAGYVALAIDQPHDREAALAAATGALAAVAATPPTARQVAIARDRLLARRATPRLRLPTWADDLAIAALTGATDRHAALAAVDAAAVARAATRVLGAPAVVVTVRPAHATPAVERHRDRVLRRHRPRPVPRTPRRTRPVLPTS